MIYSSGIQSFAELRHYGCKYVDKTSYLYNLINSGKYFYLCRPRRFGKSLTLSTLEYIFKGKKDLFNGLFIEDKWDWQQNFPVIRIDFTMIGEKSNGLKTALTKKLREIATDYKIEIVETELPNIFQELIKKLHTTYNKVFILIDEYDKPILDYIETEHHQRAVENREVLKTFYSIIKGSDEYIRFFFFTGIAKFPKLSLFSALNNLEDVSNSKELCNIVGYTETELLSVFSEQLVHCHKQIEPQLIFEEFMNEVRYWYNGYNFGGDCKVYNPFSIMLFMEGANRFKAYWSESGTPNFLIKLMDKQHDFIFKKYQDLFERVETFNIDNLSLANVLYNAGYITVVEMGKYGSAVFDYPNKEVEISLNEHITQHYYNYPSRFETPHYYKAAQAFEDNNIELAMQIFDSMLKSIPSNLFVKKKNGNRDYEKSYHLIFHLLFSCIGSTIRSEVSIAKGRIDCAITTSKYNYIVELKTDQSAEIALNQIEVKEYYKPYLAESKPIILIGININTSKKKELSWLMREM
ncbi:MAG: AAA family ATPase [Sediminibacterium sp.]|nr:AAA family ATPase [Sediminibacterium sp.]